MELDVAHRLLLGCLQKRHAPAEALRWEPASPDTWMAISAIARRHGIQPLLWKCLDEVQPSEPIPRELLDSLRRAYLLTLRRNIRVYHELGGVLSALGCRGIRAVVLKGAHLAELVYGNPGLRTLGDIDLLVRPEDLDPTQQTLVALGYGPRPRPSVRVQCAYHKSLIPFEKPGAANVDVHWAILERDVAFPVDLDGLWQRTKPINLAGTPAWGLCPEDLLVYLCLHVGYNHAFQIGLQPICDLRETLVRYRDSMDWETVRRRADAWRATKCVGLALALASELLKTVVPEEVLTDQRREDHDGQWTAMARERVLFALRVPCDNAIMCPGLAQLLGTRPFGEKLALLVRRIFVARTELACRYRVPPDWIHILPYYAAHAQYLVRQYGTTVLRVLRRDPAALSAVERDLDYVRLREWLASPNASGRAALAGPVSKV